MKFAMMYLKITQNVGMFVFDNMKLQTWGCACSWLFGGERMHYPREMHPLTYFYIDFKFEMIGYLQMTT